MIPRNELAITASRSSGPGGQNVNKVMNIHSVAMLLRADALHCKQVNTKIQVKVKVASSWIPGDVAKRLTEQNGSR
jgi:protein subunit release factor B